MRFSITSFLKVLTFSLLATPFLVAGQPMVKKEVPKAAKASVSQTVNINQATTSALEELPGIGPALAARIVSYRDENGPFKTVESLTKVKGIGSKMLEKLRPYISL